MTKKELQADFGEAINKERSGKIPKSLLFLAVFLLSLAVAATSIAFGSNKINNEENAIFANKWQYSVDGRDFAEVELPGNANTKAGSQITLKNQIPSETVSGATILMRTSLQNVVIAVGGELIYNSERSQNPVASPSSAYHFVRLPAQCANETITVKLSSPYDNYSGFMNQIYLGSKASNIFFLVQENGLRFIIGFLVFCVGASLLIVFLFSRGRDGKAAVTNLGAFFMCAGYWLLAESKMLQFIFPYPVALTNTSIFALALLPVFSGLYYYNTHSKRYRRLGKKVITIAAMGSFLLAIVSCVAPMLPVKIFPYYLIFLVIYLILLFTSIILESLKAGKFFSASVCGIVSFGVCALTELVFYLSNTRSYNKSNFLTVGILLFCVFMVADAMQNFTRIYRAAFKVEALSVLAYSDSLTGLQNRTAFLEEMSIIEHDDQDLVTIGMYDVNNLKVVNDTKGHLVGDALLRHCAKTIKASLRQQDKVYRIGGDEFAAILRHGKGFDSATPERRICSALEKENKKTLDYALSIAYGFATFSQGCDKTLYDTLARADETMYNCKREQKANTEDGRTGV